MIGREQSTRFLWDFIKFGNYPEVTDSVPQGITDLTNKVKVIECKR